MAKLAIVLIIKDNFERTKMILELLDKSSYEDIEVFIIDNKSLETNRDLLLEYLPDKEFKYDINLIELEEEKAIDSCEERAKEYITKKGIINNVIYNLT